MISSSLWRAWAAGAAMMLPGPVTPAEFSGTESIVGADPHAVTIGDELWVYPTGGDGGDRLSAWTTRDLRHWRFRGVILRRDAIGWIDDDGAPRHHLWAPALIAANGRYYLFYSVGPQNPTPSRIGVAVADRPQGPFTDSGRPLLTGGEGFEAIDPMVFRDPANGHYYLYAGGSAGSRLRIYRLADDLLSIVGEVATEQPPHFTEGAFMHERGGVYYLSYSHGAWNSAGYSVYYATGPSPVGPWRYRGVLLQSDAAHQGPGHHSFVRAPVSGDWLIVYHRWPTQGKSAPLQGERHIAVERVDYASDGTILPIAMTD